MSIRAHKVINIETNKEESFNVSHNFDLVSRLGSFTERLSEDCTGISTIYKVDVEKAIHDFRAVIQGKFTAHESAVNEEESLEILESILEEMGEEDYAEYSCY